MFTGMKLRRFVKNHEAGHWKPEQIETLRRLRGTMSAVDLAKAVGHTEWATRIQLNRQRLTVPDGGKDSDLTTISRAAKKHGVIPERMKAFLDAAGVANGKKTSPAGHVYILRLRAEDVDRAVRLAGV